MEMGMSLGLCQCQEMRQDLKLEMQQKLEQKLLMRQDQRQEMTLSQYLTRIEPLQNLFDWCQNHKDSRRLYENHGFSFIYNQVPFNVAKKAGDNITSSAGWFVALEDGTPFKVVIEGILPDLALPYVALHERGEEISGCDHFWASKLEFAAVAKERKSGVYAKAIDEKYPGKFVDLLEPSELSIPQQIKDKMNCTDQIKRELAAGSRLIEDFEFPTKVSRLALQYLKFNEYLGKSVKESELRCQREIMQKSLDETPISLGNRLVQGVTESFRQIPNEYLRVARPQLMQAYEREFNFIACKSFAEKFGEYNYHIRLNGALLQAIENAKAGKNALIFDIPIGVRERLGILQ